MRDDLRVEDAQADGLCSLVGADVSEHLCAAMFSCLHEILYHSISS